jgi:hypothetical protein
MRFQVYSLPKRGHTAEEYEDACAADAERGRFAIADGASESSYAGLWADILVKDFIQDADGPVRQWLTRLPPLRERWAASVDGRPLPWYAETKVQQGAFATFLGLSLGGSNGKGARRWDAVAVGDSCFFQVRQGSLHAAFPIARSKEFGFSPWLVGARPAGAEAPERRVVQAQGLWEAGDRFWLMTDALAQWFLQEHEEGRKPWEELEALVIYEATADEFAGWVDELREARQLHNDDVTLMIVSV